MEGEESEGENSKRESSTKSKSKSPTPEVLGSETSRSKSPTPEVTASEKSKSKSPTPELGSDNLKSRSPTPDIPESILSQSRSMTPEVNESIKSKSKSPTPEVPEYVNSKSESKSSNPEVAESSITKSKSTLPSSKSMTPDIPDSSKSKTSSVEVTEALIPKSKSMTPDTHEGSDGRSLQGFMSTVSSSKTVRIRSVSNSPPPEEPDTSLATSKSTQAPDTDLLASNTISTQTPIGPESSLSQLADSALSKSKITLNENSDTLKSKSKLLVREVSFAESYKSVAQNSQMSELRTSILSGGTASTANSGTPKGAADGRSGPIYRGGSLAVFRGAGAGGILPCGNIQGFASSLLQKRSPFIHNPPQPEERRERIASPRTPKEFIINLREDLADFQESHGLPRTRDYSFVSLGLALAQETGRAVYSLFQMFTELFPILAIVSLILRFALDKLIEIMDTPDTVPKIKKAVIFVLEMIAIVIPLWILIGTIIIPLMTLILSIFKKMIRFRIGNRRSGAKIRTKPSPGKIESYSCSGGSAIS